METINERKAAELARIQDKTLEKREAFAAAALTALITSGYGSVNTANDVAAAAVTYADALIKALNN